LFKDINPGEAAREAAELRAESSLCSQKTLHDHKRTHHSGTCLP